MPENVGPNTYSFWVIITAKYRSVMVPKVTYESVEVIFSPSVRPKRV
jgi:hypothetical protein